MKNEKGITLISVIIYVIAMVIVVSVISVITTYFYNNVINLEEKVEPMSQYTKFNSYFTKEANQKNIKILEYTENYIVFDNGVQYTYNSENKSIYRNNIKICTEITNCIFNYTIKNGKDVIVVNLTIGEKEKQTQYTLKN